MNKQIKQISNVKLKDELNCMSLYRLIDEK
jgi:hypothetical protein